MDIKQGAATAEKIVEDVSKIAGPVLTGVGLFVPGAAPITMTITNVLPLIIPDVERALNDIAAGNNGDVFATLVEFVNHIRAGQPNSPALSPNANSTAGSASQLGSG